MSQDGENSIVSSQGSLRTVLVSLRPFLKILHSVITYLEKKLGPYRALQALQPVTGVANLRLWRSGVASG